MRQNNCVHAGTFRYIVLLLTTCMFSLISCGQQATQSSNQAPSARTEDPISMQASGALEGLTDKQLVEKASLIILGTVQTVNPSRWNTKDGLRPPDLTAQNISPDLIIYTDTDVKVERLLKGSTSESTVRVRTLGGSVGQDSMTFTEEPKFEPAQSVIVFLTEEDSMTSQFGPKHYRPIGAVQGKFHIKGQQAVSDLRQLSVDELLNIINRYK